MFAYPSDTYPGGGRFQKGPYDKIAEPYTLQKVLISVQYNNSVKYKRSLLIAK